MKNPGFVKKVSAFGRHVGIKTLNSGESFQLKITARHTNAMGHAHGGAIFTLADRAFACAVNSRGRTAVALEMKINYLLAVKVGDVLSTRTKMIKEGRSTSVCQVEVWRQKDLVAFVIATAFNLYNPGDYKYQLYLINIQ